MRSREIIAEIGINHDGSKKTAHRLIDEAVGAGVHAVKFQYRNLQNVYSNAREIGDQILEKEIRKNYLEPAVLVDLAKAAQSNGLEAGISFFDKPDMADFSENIDRFDFFKLPSAELSNSALADALLQTGRKVYVSTGCHFEHEVEAALSRLGSGNWTPLHCISNYPTTLQNARLGYLSHLQRRWNRPVGYSSHDVNWEVCLLALQLGAVVIERHITLDKNSPGLDHSSSSTPDEFSKLVQFAEDMDMLASGDGPRGPNQGELLNRQNLGRSYFAVRDISVGEELSEESLVYRSPRIGVDRSNIDEFIGRKTLRPVQKGSVITRSVFLDPEPLDDNVLKYSRDANLSLPVRLHDLAILESEIPIGAYEFHLSFDEVRSSIDVTRFSSSHRYSVHIPDYVNSAQLMDPFAADTGQRDASLDILDRTAAFVQALQDRTGRDVPVVGSFSVVHDDLAGFYASHADLLSRYRKLGVVIMPQWLPPLAWYFGGSVRLHAMNSLSDVAFLKQHDIPVCMDVCHLMMGSQCFGFQPAAVMHALASNIRHVHLADAAGLDGEGLQIGDGDPASLPVIREALGLPFIKVIEVWQGHLDYGAGFRIALKKLRELSNAKV